MKLFEQLMKENKQQTKLENKRRRLREAPDMFGLPYDYEIQDKHKQLADKENKETEEYRQEVTKLAAEAKKRIPEVKELTEKCASVGYRHRSCYFYSKKLEQVMKVWVTDNLLELSYSYKAADRFLEASLELHPDGNIYSGYNEATEENNPDLVPDNKAKLIYYAYTTIKCFDEAVKALYEEYPELKNSVTESKKVVKESNSSDEILDMAQMSFETGQRFRPDDFDSKQEYNEYSSYMELGPSGFYEEYKDILDFDPDFVSEYGYLDESKKVVKEAYKDVHGDEVKPAHKIGEIIRLQDGFGSGDPKDPDNMNWLSPAGAEFKVIDVEDTGDIGGYKYTAVPYNDLAEADGVITFYGYDTSAEGTSDEWDTVGFEESKKVVKEEFSPTFPAWVKGALEPGKKGYYDKRKQPNALAKGLLGKNIDLNSATFIETEPPASSRDPILRDTTKIPIFLLDYRGDGGSQTTYYSPVSNGYSEILVPSPSGRGYEYQDLSKTPWKTILARTLKFGYFDLNDPENSMAQLRQDRAELKKKGVNRGVGQYKYKSRFDDSDSDGKWYQTKGEDKSGYKVDPYKYKKMLDTLNEDNYAKMLENTGNRINATVDKVLNLAHDPKYRTRDAFRYFERAFSYLADARYEYERVQESIDRYFNDPRYQQNYGTLGDYLKYAYTGSISKVREFLREVDNVLNNIVVTAEAQN